MKRFSAILIAALVTMATAALADWHTLTALDQARLDAAATVDDKGTLYVIGGTDDSNFFATGMRYDAVSGWQPLTKAPHPVAQGDALFYQGEIYLAGGFDGTTFVADLLIYDVSSDNWSGGAEMPAARYDYSFEAVGDTFYLIGGADVADVPQANCYAYDPVANQWTEIAPLNQARRGHGSAVVDGLIYVFGGIDDSTPTPSYLASGEVYDPSADTWTVIANLPVSYWGGASGAIAGEAWACFGLQDAELSAACWRYSPSTDTWTAGETGGEPRFHVASGAFPLYVVGGLQAMTEGYRPSTVVEQFGELEPVDDDTVDDDVADDDLADDDAADDDATDDDVDDDQSPDDDTGDDDVSADDDDNDDDSGCGC